jgi:hypothetical protein
MATTRHVTDKEEIDEMSSKVRENRRDRIHLLRSQAEYLE